MKEKLKSNSIKVVSLFDGISCGRIALERLGYTVSYYAAFEIDKYAKAISRYNYPDIEQHGDVMEADFSKFADMGIDLVIGGSPCTTWSISKANREIDKDGIGWQLFMRYAEAVRIIKPRFFFYENVYSMHKQIRQFITEELKVQPIMINSALVSAQQRKRLYWTDIPNVSQPIDRGILLKDILESGFAYQDKSHCLTATYDGAVFKNSMERRQRSMVAELASVSPNIVLADKSQTILSTLHKENALSMVKRQKKGLLVVTQQNVNTETHDINNSENKNVGAALRTRSDENGKFKRLEVRHDGKLNALTTVQTDSVVCSHITLKEADSIKNTPNSTIRVGVIGNGGQGQRIYSVMGKTVSLSANGGGQGGQVGIYKIDLPDGNYLIRKLSPIEAERCQGLDDGYTALGVDDNDKLVNISNTQRYRCIGNGCYAKYLIMQKSAA